ncbi:MAG: PAS domain S-box protein [Methanoregula sp.]|nr:PAS domain S-box protein [Methanoregula sp.]
MISVLLVDDEPALLDIAQMFLEKTGSFTVDTCLSGSQALALLVKNRYDVIVSDYEMPEMDGISLLRTLKQQGDRTPFIIFTGKGPEQVVIDALNNGATYYLQKGCNPKAQFAELSHKCRLAVQQRQSEIALKESEEKYRALVEHALEGILILDMQGTILLANNAGARTVESDSPASLHGRNVMEFIAPLSREAVLADFVRVAQGTDAYVAEYEAVTVAGNPIQVESIGKVISYESKPAILLSIRLGTRKKSGETGTHQNEMLFQTIMENAGYGAFILSGDHFRYANPHFATMTGHSPEELQKFALWDLIHPDFREKCKEIVSGVQKTGTTPADHNEVTLIAKGGVEYQVRLGLIPVEFEKNPAILGTVLDLTGQRNAESRLERINQKLHLVNEVTHHDLLNNFTALFGYFEIIQQNTTDPHNLEFMKKQEFILSAIREQIDFTGYYLDIGNASPHWQPVEDTIHEAASTLPIAPQVLNLAVGKTEILADPLLIRVFYNLMENSLRHGEHITELRFYGEKRQDGFFIIYEDNGIGVPAKNKERIFLKGMGKNSGLGLFLIKEILAITKMTIRETGEPGKGARFEIFMPEGMFR